MAKNRVAIQFTPQEVAVLVECLNMRANYMETGNVVLSALDAEAARKDFKALSLEQMEKVVLVRKLCKRLMARCPESTITDDDIPF